jgi:hypothetical protein
VTSVLRYALPCCHYLLTHVQGTGVAAAYDDTPVYEWNESFILEDFAKALNKYNEREAEVHKQNIYIMTHDEGLIV